MIYTLQEAADRLKTTPRKLRGWLLDNGDYHFRDGRSFRFEEDDIQAIRNGMVSGGPLGFIYLIGFAGYLKIGFSADPAERIAGLQTAIPEPITTFCVFRGRTSDEQRYHRMFAPLRLNGEWFRSDPSIIKTLTAAAKALNSFFEGRT